MRSPTSPFPRLLPRRRSGLVSARRIERYLVPAVVVVLVFLAVLIAHASAASVPEILRPDEVGAQNDTTGIAKAHAPAAPVPLRAEPAKSEFTIELGKAGLLKAFGDDHLIGVTDYLCEVLLDEQDLANSSVRIAIPTASLKVLDPKLADEKRAEVQKRMEGPDVLDVARFPEITFVSRRVKAAGNGRFQIEGDLKIRDTTRPIVLEVSLAPEATIHHARGEARIRQTSFGIRPVTAVGGTIKVKDEMKIVFDLVLVPVGP